MKNVLFLFLILCLITTSALAANVGNGGVFINGVQEGGGSGGGGGWTASGSDTYITTGNVGIGTADPQVTLDVFDATGPGLVNISVEDDTSWIALEGLTGNDGSDKYQLYQFGDGYTTSGRYVSGSTLMDALNDGGLGLSASHASGEISFWTGGNNERMIIDSSGNVGIGTNQPNYALDFGPSSVRIGSNRVIGTNNNQALEVGGFNLILTGNNGTDHVILGSNGDFDITTGDLEVTGGNVGIGTSAPVGPLVVYGADVDWGVPTPTTNTACDGQCTYGCLGGFDKNNVEFVSCSSTLADSCQCAGPN